MGGVYAPLSKIASEKGNSGAEPRLVIAQSHRRCRGQPRYHGFGDENFAQILFLLRDLTLPE
jgi:hypothetical protein